MALWLQEIFFFFFTHRREVVTGMWCDSYRMEWKHWHCASRVTIGCSAVVYSSVVVIAIGDVPLQRKHEKHDSHRWTRHEADAKLHSFTRGRVCVCVGGGVDLSEIPKLFVQNMKWRQEETEHSAPPADMFLHQSFICSNYLSDYLILPNGFVWDSCLFIVPLLSQHQILMICILTVAATLPHDTSCYSSLSPPVPKWRDVVKGK